MLHKSNLYFKALIWRSIIDIFTSQSSCLLVVVLRPAANSRLSKLRGHLREKIIAKTENTTNLIRFFPTNKGFLGVQVRKYQFGVNRNKSKTIKWKNPVLCCSRRKLMKSKTVFRYTELMLLLSGMRSRHQSTVL